MTGNAPIASEWSIILLATKSRLILEVWGLFLHQGTRMYKTHMKLIIYPWLNLNIAYVIYVSSSQFLQFTKALRHPLIQFVRNWFNQINPLGNHCFGIKGLRSLVITMNCWGNEAVSFYQEIRWHIILPLMAFIEIEHSSLHNNEVNVMQNTHNKLLSFCLIHILPSMMWWCCDDKYQSHVCSSWSNIKSYYNIPAHILGYKFGHDW